MIVTSPTHDGRNVVIVLWPQDEFEAVRADIEGALHGGGRAGARPGGAAARRHARGAASAAPGCCPTTSAAPSGPGWALAGDAGHHKDPILALGIGDAFRDADLLAEAVDRGLDGDLDAELAAYGERRDALARPGFESTIEFAGLQPADARAAGAVRAAARRPGADRPLLRRRSRARSAPDEFFSAAGAAAAFVKRRGTAASSPSS